MDCDGLGGQVRTGFVLGKAFFLAPDWHLGACWLSRKEVPHMSVEE